MLKIQSRKEAGRNNHCMWVLPHLLGLSLLFFPCRKKTHVRWFITNCIDAGCTAQLLGPVVNPSPERRAAGAVPSAARGVLVERCAPGKVTAQPRAPPGPPWTFHHVKIDLPQTTYTISCIVEDAGSTLGPHISAPVNPAANGMTKKNPHHLDNLVVCNLFLSELKPALIPTKRQAKGMN